MVKRIKSTRDKIEALKMGLTALRNANNHFRETTDHSYLLTVQSQLRGLVGIGGKSMHPLLINLSKELEIQLEMYAFTASLSESRTSSTVIGRTWSSLPINGFIKIKLEDWLLSEDFFAIGSRQFKNRNQIIKDASNFEGGTHYLEEIPHIVESLKGEKIGNLDNLTATLLDIAEAVFYLGHLLIMKHEYKTIQSLLVIDESEKIKRLIEIKNLLEKHEQRFAEINNYRNLNGILVGYSE